MAKPKVRKSRGSGVTLAGGKRKMKGKGFAGDIFRSQAPSIAGSILGEVIKLGLTKMLTK